MSAELMTSEQIRRVGLDAVAGALGPIGTVRFLRQFEVGKGDYSKARQDLLPDCDVAALTERIRERRLDRPVS